MALRELGLREDIDPIQETLQSVSNDQKPTSRNENSTIRLGSSPAPSSSDGDVWGGVLFCAPASCERTAIEEMGIAAGGKIRQQIFQDTYGVESWDFNRRRPLKIHMVNSMAYKSITGQDPPPSPVTAEQYQKASIPWFSQYDETAPSVKGAGTLNKILGIGVIDKRRGMTDSPPISSIHINPDVIRKIKTPDLKDAIQNFRRRARQDTAAGRWAAAIREINYLIDLETGVESQDYALRCLCNYQIKRYLEGMFDGDKALEMHSENPEALTWRARCRIAVGDSDGGFEDAEHLIRLAGYESSGYEIRAEASLLSGDYASAMSDAYFSTLFDSANQRAAEIGVQARRLREEHSRKEYL
jgi:hypothetical protein